MSAHVKLPTNWCCSTLGESCKILAGFGFPERLQGKTVGELPFFKVGDISESWKRGEIHLTKANHYLSQKEAAEISARPLPKNTTVFAKIGAAIALNRRAILSEPALVDNNVMGLYPATEAIDHKFLFHFICTVKLDELSRATTVPSVRKSDIEQIRIPLPPLPEQRRIVAEIEKQFSRLEEGVSALKRVQTNLKRYRAAVLKAACEGLLVETEAELYRKRKTKSSKLGFEPGEQLLKRILAERRKTWKGRGQYKEPAAPDTTNLPERPEGWTWASVSQLCFLDVGFAFKSAEFASAGVRLLRGDNLEPGRMRWVDTRYWPEAKLDEFRHLLIREGEIVLAMDRPLISSGLKIARARADDLPCLLVQRMARFRPVLELMNTYLFTTLNTVAFIRHLLGGQTGTQLPHISSDGIQSFLVPLPPLAEQKRIVEEVERRLSVVEELESLVTTNLQRATRLRQSILQKAFEGKL